MAEKKDKREKKFDHRPNRSSWRKGDDGKMRIEAFHTSGHAAQLLGLSLHQFTSLAKELGVEAAKRQDESRGKGKRGKVSLWTPAQVSKLRRSMSGAPEEKEADPLDELEDSFE